MGWVLRARLSFRFPPRHRAAQPRAALRPEAVEGAGEAAKGGAAQDLCAGFTGKKRDNWPLLQIPRVCQCIFLFNMREPGFVKGIIPVLLVRVDMRP